MCGCLLCIPHWGPGLQPRPMAWLGIKPAILWFAGWHSIHWATPARAQNRFLTVLSTVVSAGNLKIGIAITYNRYGLFEILLPLCKELLCNKNRINMKTERSAELKDLPQNPVKDPENTAFAFCAGISSGSSPTQRYRWKTHSRREVSHREKRLWFGCIILN